MLGQLPAPLLVVVDDIDRLTPQEQQVVFQLVKANADFPNLVYLLSFDRVAGALSGLGLEGDVYLGKIVQVGFNLPLARSSDVHSVLTEGLECVLGADALRPSSIKHTGIGCSPPVWRPTSQTSGMSGDSLTPRFQVTLLGGDGILEVNPIDLVAVEVLRVFEPSLYNVLPGLKGELAPDPSRLVFNR